MKVGMNKHRLSICISKLCRPWIWWWWW